MFTCKRRKTWARDHHVAVPENSPGENRRNRTGRGPGEDRAIDHTAIGTLLNVRAEPSPRSPRRGLRSWFALLTLACAIPLAGCGSSSSNGAVNVPTVAPARVFK